MELRAKSLDTVAVQTGESMRSDVDRVDNFKSLKDLLSELLTRLGNRISDKKPGGAAEATAAGKFGEETLALDTWNGSSHVRTRAGRETELVTVVLPS